MSSDANQHKLTIYRHPLVVRLTHWINVLCMTLLLMSGLQIFNAHPALYLGQQSDFDNPVLAIGVGGDGNKSEGVTTILGKSFKTTGILGLSRSNGSDVPRAFPAWATVPSTQDLATGRTWHFFFAWLFVLNGVAYAVYGAVSRHLWRDLVPSRVGLRDIGRSLRDHLRLRFPTGEEARHYNVLQQITYLLVIVVLLPLMVLTGLMMSPALDSWLHPLVNVFGGRQTARTIHFIAATLAVLFVLVHVAMVVASGPLNDMRSMVTGWFALGRERRS